MSRDYWLEVSIREADGDDPGFAGGGRIKVSWSDEDIQQILQVDLDFIMKTIIPRLREKEAEYERKAAAPFWKKWVGGA